MRTEAQRDAELMRYLRGELAGEERDRLEEAYFVDERLHERLLILEDQWIDAYVRGQLPAEDRQRLERRLETSPERRRKLEFARALHRIAAREATAPARCSWWQRALAFLPVQAPPVWAAALAAAILFAVPLTYLNYSRRTDGQASVGRSTPRVGAPAETPNATPGPRTLPVLAFALEPLERSAGSANRVLIPAGEYTIRLHMEVEGAAGAGLSALVRTAEGAEVAVVRELETRAGAGRSEVFVSLPSRLLQPGQYVLRLRSTAADGTTELIGAYTFEAQLAP